MPSLDTFTLAPFDPASALFPTVVQLYERIWPSPPESPSHGESLLRRHATYPGYVGIAALTPDGAVAGLAYGTTDLPGQWWHEQVARVLGPQETARSLTESFAVTSLGVDTAWRGQGLGSWLLEQLLARVPHERATLSTEVTNTTARRLYERLGWRYVVERMRFAADGSEWVIMGRELGYGSCPGARRAGKSEPAAGFPKDTHACQLQTIP